MVSALRPPHGLSPVSRTGHRLALVTETFPPEVNGVAQVLGRWVRTFSQRGHRVQVIRPARPKERSSFPQVLGLSLPFYKEVRFGMATPARLLWYFHKIKPDLVHLATEGPLGLAALIAARVARLPVSSSFHTNFDGYLAHYGLNVFSSLSAGYLRWFHNRCGVTFVPSLTTQDRLCGLGFRRVEIWSRGVDAERFHPSRRDDALRTSLGLRPEDVLLLYVGRLAPEKNLTSLVEAFGRLRGAVAPSSASGRRVKLALVGGGPLEPSLRGLRAPDVLFGGVQIGDDLARWYASADVFAFPSRSETFGNVVLEAMASGLPVVAFDCPVLSERVSDGEDGFLVRDGGDLVAPLVELVTRPDLRRAMSVTARASAGRRGWEPIFDSLERRYSQMITEARSRREEARHNRWSISAAGGAIRRWVNDFTLLRERSHDSVGAGRNRC